MMSERGSGILTWLVSCNLPLLSAFLAPLISPSSVRAARRRPLNKTLLPEVGGSVGVGASSQSSEELKIRSTKNVAVAAARREGGRAADGAARTDGRPVRRATMVGRCT